MLLPLSSMPVSYTHLDVYKRQGYTRIFCNDEEQKQISIDEYMNYMHLDDKDRFSQWLEENLKEKEDVYKRQGYRQQTGLL